MKLLEFMNDVPPLVRLVLAIVVFVGLSLLLVHVFHDRSIGIAQEPTDEPTADEGDANVAAAEATTANKRKVPDSTNLTGRVIALATTAFVFMLAFGFSQFWSHNKDAQEAVVNEFVGYTKASLYIDQLPDSQGKQAMQHALADYVTSYDAQWPSMREGDQAGAIQIQGEANRAILTTTVQAARSGLSDDSLWSSVTSALDDMSMAAVDRLTAMPSRASQSIIVLIFILGVANLALVAVFQPVRKPVNLVAIALFAGVTAVLLFVLIEVSNPYSGGAAVMPLIGS